MPIVLNGRRAKRDGDWQKTLDWQLAVAKLKFLTVANLDVAITKDWVFGILSAVLTTNQRVDLRSGRNPRLPLLRHDPVRETVASYLDDNPPDE